MLYTLENIQALRPIATSETKPNAFFTADEWEAMDAAVATAVRPRLQIFQLLEEHGCGMREEYDITRMWVDDFPLPFIHKDFYIHAKHVADSRKEKYPDYMTIPLMAAQYVAEKVERFLLGIDSDMTNITVQDKSLYGFCNHPDRQTLSIENPLPENPLPANYCPEAFRSEAFRKTLLNTLKKAKAMLFEKGFNKFLVVLSPMWTNCDVEVEQIKSETCVAVMVSEFLPNWTAVVVQLSPDVITAYTDLDITPVKWKSTDEFNIHMKVVCRKVPLLRNPQGVVVITAE